MSRVRPTGVSSDRVNVNETATIEPVCPTYSQEREISETSDREIERAELVEQRFEARHHVGMTGEHEFA
jgi:hypothetical protein